MNQLKKIMMMLIKLCKKITISPHLQSKIVLDDDKLPIPNEEFNPITLRKLSQTFAAAVESPIICSDSPDSPDVVLLKFSKKCADIGNKTNMMYNKMNRILLDSQKQNFKTFASPERVLLCNMKNFNPSTSGTKPIHHDLRR
uniref:Uncharacterized protein n=1 Tax=Oryza rufipogon TaxID=4529 RepID=A0A0E0NUJ9_ORYRU